MAITSSAKKALRVSKRKRVFNMRRSDAMKTAIKSIRVLVAAKKASEAATFLPEAFRAIDKAAKTKYIKKNAASRYKSRLAALVKKAS